MADVKITITGVKELEARLDPKRIKRIRWSAINEAVRAGRTLMSREIREALAAPAFEINKAIKFERVGKDDAGGVGEITVRRKPIPLKRFNPRQTKAGVSILVRKDQGRRIIKGAFGPRISKLSGRVVKRVGKAAFPLKDLYGQTAASIAANSPGLIGRVTKRIAEQLQKRYVSKLNYELTKAG